MKRRDDTFKKLKDLSIDTCICMSRNINELSDEGM